MLGLIPRSFIDELLNRTDIVEFIDGYIPLKKQGASFIACCPFHSEKTPSFNVISKKQFYHCFGCGESGNAISFAMNYLHQSFSDAVETLATRLGMQVPREGRTTKQQPSTSLYHFLDRVSQFYQHTLKSSGSSAIAYLKQRGVTGVIAKHYQLGYAPEGWHLLETHFKQHKEELVATGMLIVQENGKTYDRYRQRIMFPIHDRHGRIIGFGGRAIESTQKPKYINSPETIIFQKNRELYGLHHVIEKKKPIHHIVIVEGYMDVIALAQHGLWNVVATLGTATSSYHIQLLSKHTKQLIFCFDGDDAGRQAAWRALESCLPHLNAGLDVGFIFLPEGHDPDSLVRQEGLEQFNHRVHQAIPLHQYFIESLTSNMDTSKLAGKSQLVNQVKPYLLKISQGPYQQLLLDEIARLTRIEPHRLLQLMAEKHSETTTPKNQHIPRSPVRIAIAIVLQHPEILIECASQLPLESLDVEKYRVLKKLIQQVIENPSINTAKLIELWRDSPLFDAFSQLASWEHWVPEDALKKEFIDIILFLAKQNQDDVIQQLLKKAHEHGLSEIERHHLQNLLKERHRMTNEK